MYDYAFAQRELIQHRHKLGDVDETDTGTGSGTTDDEAGGSDDKIGMHSARSLGDRAKFTKRLAAHKEAHSSKPATDTDIEDEEEERADKEAARINARNEALAADESQEKANPLPSKKALHIFHKKPINAPASDQPNNDDDDKHDPLTDRNQSLTITHAEEDESHDASHTSTLMLPSARSAIRGRSDSEDHMVTARFYNDESALTMRGGATSPANNRMITARIHHDDQQTARTARLYVSLLLRVSHPYKRAYPPSFGWPPPRPTVCVVMVGKWMSYDDPPSPCLLQVLCMIY